MVTSAPSLTAPLKMQVSGAAALVADFGGSAGARLATSVLTATTSGVRVSPLPEIQADSRKEIPQQ